MPSVPRETIESSLREKGFRRHDQEGNPSRRRADHRFYYFYYNEKRTHIRTKISMGTNYRDYGTSLLKTMKLQLKFDRLSDLLAFLRCPLHLEDYLAILKRKGEL